MSGKLFNWDNPIAFDLVPAVQDYRVLISEVKSNIIELVVKPNFVVE